MGLDPLSVIAPARVKVLLVPLGRITSSRFSSFVDRLGQENVVRLGDVSPDGRPHRTMFSPLAFPAGSILYDLSTSVPLPSHSSLSPFELYREPLAILGLADGINCCNKSENHTIIDGDGAQPAPEDYRPAEHKELLEGLERIKEAYPRALVHQIFLFDHAKDTKSLPDDMVSVPPPEHSKTTTIRTIMCDLASQLLGEMTALAKSLQALPTIKSPRSASGISRNDGSGSANAIRPTSVAQGSRSISPITRDSKNQHRMSMPVNLPSDPNFQTTKSEARGRSPPSRVQSPATTFDEIAAARKLPSPFQTIGSDSRHQSEDTLPMQGFGAGGLGERERMKGKGRVGIVIGSMYLLAGRWPDAIKELSESVTASKANNDYIWIAKALDYILVTLLLEAWAGIDFKIPPILYPALEKPGSTNSKSSSQSQKLSDSAQNDSTGTTSRLVSLQNLINLLPELVNNVLSLYTHAWTYTDDKIPAISYSDTVVRFCKLLTVIQLSHGILDDRGLRRVVLNVESVIDRVALGEPRPFPTKAEIMTTLFRALPNSKSGDTLPVADRVVILAGISSVLSELGYQRKNALVLKELASGLLPALVQARKDGAAQMGVHPAASLIALSAAVGNAVPQLSDSRTGDSEHGLRNFLGMICLKYGILLAGPTILDGDGRDDRANVDHHTTSSSYDSDDNIIARAVQQASGVFFGAQQVKLDVLQACINICEALPDLGGVLRFSADTLRTAGSGVAPGPESSEGSPALPIDDQVRLANNISRTLSAGQQLGIASLEAEYWDEFLVRGIELPDRNTWKSPMLHAKSELEVASASQAQVVKNPFIYNPFGDKTASDRSEPTVVAGEGVVLRVTVQNLYDFDLEIESIQLESNGVPFESSPIRTIVGPYRTQTMGLKGVPLAAGIAHITGCVAKIKGCRERRFPLFAKPWTLKMDSKTRVQGFTTMHLAEDENALESSASFLDPTKHGPVISSLRLSVIDAQPNVSLKSTSLPQSAVMLLEGESKTFTVTLQNMASQVPADLVLISFKDSTASQLQSALANKDLTLAELYELELSATRNQSFQLVRTASDLEPAIDPGGTFTFKVRIHGKPGLSHGTIQVDFAYLGVPRAEVKDRFYTCQLSIPLAVTVNASVDLLRNDLIPFTSDFVWQNQQRGSRPPSSSSSASSTPKNRRHSSTSTRKPNQDNKFSSLLSRLGLHSQEEEHVLLLLDLRNSWPNLVTTSVEVLRNTSKSASDASKRAYTLHETMQPGHTSRLVLILPRLYISNPHAPIPSLNQATKRQYVVSATRDTSPEAELAAREAFWYREELLKRIRATWREDSTGRTGTINLRSLRLSSRMVSALKLDDIGIRFSVLPSSSSSSSKITPTDETELVKQTGRATFEVPTSTFLTLRTQILNRSPAPIHPLLRLQPTLRNQPHNIALDLSKKFLWSGVLQRVLPVLEGGQETNVDMGICVLSQGSYEVGAAVEEVRVLVGEDGDGKKKEEEESEDLVLRGRKKGERERRVWYSGEACVVVSKDSREEVS